MEDGRQSLLNNSGGGQSTPAPLTPARMTVMQTSVQSSITWALPVKADVLGAHVEAYAETLAACQMLRLCALYRLSPKLPLEVVIMIEGFLMEPAREKAFLAWSTGLRCSRERCNEAKHSMTDNELENFRPEPPRQGQNLSGSGPDGSVHVWQEKSGLWPNVDDFFTRKHGKLLMSHFGVEIGINTRYDTMRDVQFLTAYLMLPHTSQHSERESSEWTAKYDYVCTVPATLDAIPSEELLARFKRTAKVLGLETSTQTVWSHSHRGGVLITSPRPLKFQKTVCRPIRWAV